MVSSLSLHVYTDLLYNRIRTCISERENGKAIRTNGCQHPSVSTVFLQFQYFYSLIKRKITHCVRISLFPSYRGYRVTMVTSHWRVTRQWPNLFGDWTVDNFVWLTYIHTCVRLGLCPTNKHNPWLEYRGYSPYTGSMCWSHGTGSDG